MTRINPNWLARIILALLAGLLCVLCVNAQTLTGPRPRQLDIRSYRGNAFTLRLTFGGTDSLPTLIRDSLFTSNYKALPTQPDAATRTGRVVSITYPNTATLPQTAYHKLQFDGQTVAAGTVVFDYTGSSAVAGNVLSLTVTTGTAAPLSVSLAGGYGGGSGSVGPQGPAGPAGPQGIQGIQGVAGPAGPQGATGAQGIQGPIGLTGATGPKGDTGDTGNTGATGPTGDTGAQGPAGTAATIQVGTVTTGAAGTSASVTNVGTTSAAVFNFTIPRGADGSGGSGSGDMNKSVYDGNGNDVVDNSESLNGQVASYYLNRANQTGNIPLANVAGLPDSLNVRAFKWQLPTNNTQLTNGAGYITASGAPVQSVVGKNGIVTLTKSDVGLSNVDNTSDSNKPVSTDTQTALNSKEATITAGTTGQYWRGDKSWQTLNKTAVGLSNVPNTDATLRANHTGTQVQSTIASLSDSLSVRAYKWQLPTNNNQLTNGANYITSAGAPVQSVAGKTGTVSLAKADVGLSNVDNTSDAAKPVSTATQTALNGKEATLTAGTTGQYYRGDKTWQTLDKSAVGLGNVPNTDATQRANHSGTQAQSTVTALSDSLNTRAYKWQLNTKQNMITLTTTGTSGAATFNPGTGALNIPNYATSNAGRAAYENVQNYYTFVLNTVPGGILQNVQSGGTNNFTSIAGRIGYYGIYTGTGATGRNALCTAMNVVSVTPSGVTYALEWVLVNPAFSDGSQTFTTIAGFINDATNVPSNGAYFEFSTAQLQAFVRSGGSTTANPTNLLTLTANTAYRLRIELSAGLVKFYAVEEPAAGYDLNEVWWNGSNLLYSETSANITIPQANMGFGVYTQKSAGTTARGVGLQKLIFSVVR